jgi:hypothetical protein
MSEIKRTNEVEKYNTTVGWLDEFFLKMARNAPPSPPIATASTEKFATIEEKMADIKSRVGFSSVSDLKKESSAEIISESTKKCKCGKSKKNCVCKNKKDNGRTLKLKTILKYISDMIEAEPHLLEPEILARCADNRDLNFESIGIRPKKLSSFINSKKTPKSETIEVIYIKPDSNNSSNPLENMADYYRHGMPNLF